MRKVKRWRYYCDFCKKAGGSGGHIAEHEKHCTNNPNRICRVCGMLEADQKPMWKLLLILPNGAEYQVEEEEGFISYGTLSNETEKCMRGLRDLTENCPACIMAALRQSNIPVPMVKSFNFTAEMDSIWGDINEAARQEEYRSGCYY